MSVSNSVTQAETAAGSTSTTNFNNEFPVPVAFKPDADMFPDHITEDIKPFVTALNINEVDRSSQIVTKAMAKYPKCVLQSNLDRVYVLGRFEIGGIEVGGSFTNRRIYICNRGIAGGDTDATIEFRFHHELMSVLLRNHWDIMNHARWLEGNPTGFKYLGSGVEAIKQGKASNVAIKALLEEGFCTEYAKASYDDDVSAIAAEMFVHRRGFWRIVDVYPRIRHKVDCVIEFLSQISPTFDEEYFRSLPPGL